MLRPVDAIVAAIVADNEVLDLVEGVYRTAEADNDPGASPTTTSPVAVADGRNESSEQQEKGGGGEIQPQIPENDNGNNRSHTMEDEDLQQDKDINYTDNENDYNNDNDYNDTGDKDDCSTSLDSVASDESYNRLLDQVEASLERDRQIALQQPQSIQEERRRQEAIRQQARQELEQAYGLQFRFDDEEEQEEDDQEVVDDVVVDQVEEEAHRQQQLQQQQAQAQEQQQAQAQAAMQQRNNNDNNRMEAELLDEDTTILAAALIRQHQLLLAVVHDALPNLRMQISDVERQWAFIIKSAVEADPELDDLTDFGYVQHALTITYDQDNDSFDDIVKAVVERIRNIQTYKQEYGVLDTLSDACHQVERLIMDIMPGLILSLTYNHLDGNYMVVIDIANFDMAAIATQERFSQWMAGAFYIFHAMNPDIEAIRRGVVLLYECEGYDWNLSMDVKTWRKSWTELGMQYPCWYQQIKCFNTGLFFNLLVSMGKRFLPPQIQSKFQTGCKFEGGRLDGLYMLPTIELAQERILSHFLSALRLRYKQEANFSLVVPEAEGEMATAAEQGFDVGATEVETDELVVGNENEPVVEESAALPEQPTEA